VLHLASELKIASIDIALTCHSSASLRVESWISFGLSGPGRKARRRGAPRGSPQSYENIECSSQSSGHTRQSRRQWRYECLGDM